MAASQPSLETDHNRPNISLIDKANNVFELMPKVKEKSPPEPENVTFSEELSKLFPEANEKMIEQKDEIPDLQIQDLDQISSKIDRGEIPKHLNFFTGGINREFGNKVRSLGILTNSADFLNFRQSDICEDLMKNNKLKIHVHTGHIFHNNIDTNESIFDFFENQEDETKQFLEDFEFNITDSYDDYFMKYLVNIKDGNDDKFDMLTNKNSKFFFYYTNNYLRQINEQVKLIRHSVITNNETALEILQNKDWQYFMERILEVCQSSNNE